VGAIGARLQEPGALGLSASQIGEMSEDVDIESEVEEIVRVLSDQGPLTRRELRNSVQSQLEDPDHFPRALRLAIRRGLVLRQGSRFASAMGEG
jgi:hypothetical protein